jgi:hypothetical protein
MSSSADSQSRFSRPWFLSGWKILRAGRAEGRGDFRRALQLLDEAAEIMPLKARFRVKRANLLLRLERADEAYRAFDRLRQEFKDSTSPERQYLRHYCTAMLSLMQPGSAQWSYEAKQGNAIKCPWYVKGLLPMVSVDDIHEKIKPRW